ncbi:MAG: serine/threonine protein kinase [Lachnospiraceae bacterium]|nr:serine/threonine protein kinase [Lachnospiraceae bacterium]
MDNQLCFRCFKIKGNYEVCPHCGYDEKTEAAQAYQLMPGTVLRGRYIIGTSIGIGGFGITYKAYDTVLGIVVAIKEFYPAGMVNRGEGETRVGVFSGEKEEEFRRQLERFLEEARNMAIFSKEEDIINVFDYFEENQTAYIIMEFVDAPLLKARLREKGRMEAAEAVRYIAALLDALSKVHYNGIIHKDISPDNIFLTGEDTVKVFDFGAAKFQGTETERTEDVVVKAGYTPPEQYRAKNEQGAFMDIYAAGAVFYEMVTGEKPMEAPDRAVEEGLKKPSEFGIEIDENLERVILKALALKPELRFQTAEQFKDAIVSQKRVELPEEELRRRRRRKRFLTAGLASVFVAMGGILILSQTYFSGRGRIDVSAIPAESLEIWLPQESPEAGSELSQTLLESVEKECPQLEVTVNTIDAQAYASRIGEAAEEGHLPDVFCTEGLVASEHCADLSKLLRTMKLSSYLCLGELGKKDVYELPTALQIGVAYVNEEKETKLPQSIESGELAGQQGKFGYADEEEAFPKFQDMEEPTAWIVGDLSAMEQVEAVTVEMLPPTDFTVVPILHGGKLVASAEHCYGVRKDMDGAKGDAAMFLLSLLLSDGMQSVSYMDNEEGIPLNRAAYDSYKENKMTTYLAFLKEYDLQEAEISQGESICGIIRGEIGGDRE